MKFSTNEDIEAPIDDVFKMLSDFDKFERSALRRGADVRRTDSTGRTGVGMTWAAAFKFRGKQRKLEAEVVEFTRPDSYAIEARSPNLNGIFELELVPLSQKRTRASMALTLTPKSLSGRLMLQTMKLGKSKLTRRYKIQVADFAKFLEKEYNASKTV